MVEPDGRARQAGGPQGRIRPQGVFAALAPAAGQRDPDQRLRLGGELVRPPGPDPAGDEGVALREPGHDGARRSLRDRGEVRLPRPGVGRDGRRRSHADGGMAELLTAAKYYGTLARPAPRHPGAQQRGPQPGDLGAAGDGGRPPVRGLPGHPVRALIPVRRDDRAEGDPGRPSRRRSRMRGSEAFAADRPVVIDALTDPEEPPLPPHITFEQARARASRSSETPRPAARRRRGVREKIEELRPGR